MENHRAVFFHFEHDIASDDCPTLILDLLSCQPRAFRTYFELETSASYSYSTSNLKKGKDCSSEVLSKLSS